MVRYALCWRYGAEEASAGTSAGGSAGCAAYPVVGLLNDNPGFEDGTFSNEWEPSAQITDDCLIEVVSDVVRSGSRTVRRGRGLENVS